MHSEVRCPTQRGRRPVATVREDDFQNGRVSFADDVAARMLESISPIVTNSPTEGRSLISITTPNKVLSSRSANAVASNGEKRVDLVMLVFERDGFALLSRTAFIKVIICLTYAVINAICRSSRVLIVIVGNNLKEN